MVKISKQKLFRHLNILGVGFVVALIIGYFQFENTAAPRLENQIEVPRLFKRQFSNVDTLRRWVEPPDITFLNPENTPVSWDNFSGEYLLVNFWATWCAPCVLELPSLGKLKKRYSGKGLNVIAVSIDSMRSHEDIKNFLLSRNIDDFAAHFDRDQLIQANIPMRGIPTSFLLDSQGNLLYIFEGDADWASPPSYSFFDALLNR